MSAGDDMSAGTQSAIPPDRTDRGSETMLRQRRAAPAGNTAKEARREELEHDKVLKEEVTWGKTPAGLGKSAGIQDLEASRGHRVMAQC